MIVKMSGFALLALLSVFLSVEAVTTNEKWNDLRTTFGIHPNDINFHHMPRTTTEADEASFVKVSDCDTSAKWRGSQYVYDDDYGVILLFDVNGYIAGMQTTVPKDSSSNYPSFGGPSAFVEDGDNYLVTVYFVDPSTICTTGRTEAEFQEQGTGTNLYLQIGDVPENSPMVPHHESDLIGSAFVQGRCNFMMGMHYFYAISENMDCDSFHPLFLLYNDGHLNGFGFVILREMQSIRYELASKLFISRLFDDVPQCVEDYGVPSILHVFLSSPVIRNTC